MHPSVNRRYKGWDPKAQHAALRKTLKHVGLPDALLLTLRAGSGADMAC